MENKIEVFVFDRAVTMQDNIKKFVASKIALKKALKNMEALEELYQDEIQEAGNILHITGDGVTMFVSEMDDAHLLNTIKLFVSRGYRINDHRVKKYIDEAKKRNLAQEILDIAKGNSPIQETYDIFFDEDDEVADF